MKFHLSRFTLQFAVANKFYSLSKSFQFVISIFILVILLACRLYFQSIGDVKEVVLTQKQLGVEEDAGVLRKEVKRLEVKVSGISSVLERQTRELDELKDELCTCKEQTKKEIALKNEALNQKASMQIQLHVKTDELEKSSLERGSERFEKLLFSVITILLLLLDVV
uniref:Uncharacterized protein LOC113784793 n=1 Tax=Cicer arietinum TaxID=3827 RepID=A0A3Q7XSL7_CICAR|nr:uncharacterized protein LOC113784793 [Cicer arietinum]